VHYIDIRALHRLHATADGDGSAGATANNSSKCLVTAGQLADALYSVTDRQTDLGPTGTLDTKAPRKLTITNRSEIALYEL